MSLKICRLFLLILAYFCVRCENGRRGMKTVKAGAKTVENKKIDIFVKLLCKRLCFDIKSVIMCLIMFNGRKCMNENYPAAIRRLRAKLNLS